MNERGPPPVAGTARFIARSLLVASGEKRYAALLPPESGALYQRLLSAAGDHRFVGAATNPLFRALFQPAVRLILPGIVLHYLARKRCLEDRVRGACGLDDPAAGACTQIVVLGAGLDTLAWRLHGRHPGISFFEVDRPDTLRIKAAAMGPADSSARNLTFLPADLADETLTAALARCPAFDPAASTLFFAEGLLMYLPVERVRSFFREIAALAAPGEPHSFAFTFMEARAGGRVGFRRSRRVVDWWLRRQGEPFRWSQDPDTLAAFLAPTGFRLHELVSGDTLRARYLAPRGLRDAPLAMGEWLAFAQTTGIP